MPLYTYNTHTHTAHTCMKSTILQMCALGVCWAESQPTDFHYVWDSNQALICSVSSPRGFTMFEKHWKLMTCVVNLLVSISSVNSKLLYSMVGASRVTRGKEPTCQCRRHRFDPWVGKIPWRRKWQPTPVFLPGQFRGQRSLTGYSPWGHRQSDTTEHTCMLTAWSIPTLLSLGKEETQCASTPLCPRASVHLCHSAPVSVGFPTQV